MIQFKKLRWKNFLSTGNVFTEIDLDTGRNTLCIGSNGSGKTSFIDALVFVLYNKAYRNINKPQLVNSLTEKNLLVEIEMIINGVAYLIRRGMKPNIFEIHCNGKLIDQSSDNRDYQEVLEKEILKVDYKTFTQIVILGVTNYIPFMKLAALSRRQVVEDLLDMQLFSVMAGIVKSDLSSCKETLLSLTNQQNVISEKRKLNREHLENVDQDIKAVIEQKNKQIYDYAEMVVTLRESIVADEKELKDLAKIKAKIDANNQKQIELYKTRVKVEQAIKKREEQVRFYDTHADCPTCKQGIDKTKCQELTNAIAGELKDAAKALNVVNNKIADVTKKFEDKYIQEVESTITKVNNRIKESKTKIEMYNGFIDSYKKELEGVSKSTTSRDKLLDIDAALTKEFDAVFDDLQKVKERKRIIEIAIDYMKDNGVKSKIVDQYVPIINKLVNKYLEYLDFYIDFSFDNNFVETINCRGKQGFKFDSFSEGEKVRINLALLFAWREIALMRNSSACSILILDEVFDGSLDSVGVYDLQKLLTMATQNGRFSNFIISHKDTMHESFSDVLKFEKVNNFSQVKQVRAA